MSANDKEAPPTDKEVVEELPKTRNPPVQQRSHVRLKSIGEAAERVLARVGRDRLTTAMVAAESGSSIGTIYRYFKDRIAILDYVWPDRRDTFPKRKKKSK